MENFMFIFYLFTWKEVNSVEHFYINVIKMKLPYTLHKTEQFSFIKNF